MKQSILTSLFIFSIVSCFSQNIKSFTVVPSNPTSTSIVKVFTHVEFNSNAIPVSNSTLQTGNVIDINRCYSLGMLTIMDQVKDTLVLGTMAPGVYTVNYLGAITNSTSDCSSPSQTYTSSLTFTVSGTPNGIAKHAQGMSVTLYPNPFKDKVTINSSSAELLDIKVYDCLGNLIVSRPHQKPNEVIDLSELSKGLYVVQACQGPFKANLRLIKN